MSQINSLHSKYQSYIQHFSSSAAQQTQSATPSIVSSRSSGTNNTNNNQSLNKVPQSSNGILQTAKSVLDLISNISSLSGEIANRKEEETDKGNGTLKGSSNYSNSANVARELVNLYEQSLLQGKIKVGSDLESNVDQIGAFAQEYLMGRLKGDALAHIAKTTGVDLTNMSFPELAEKALGHVAKEIGITLPSLNGTVIGDIASQILGTQGSATSGVTGVGSQQTVQNGTQATGQLSSGASSILSAAGAAYAGYNLINSWGKTDPVTGAVNGATAGAYIGSQLFPGIGTVVGGIIGGVVGLVGGFLKKGKHPDQIARDTVRGFMREKGIIDDKWQLTMADGSKFDIGRDGRKTLTNMDGTTRAMYNTDLSNPLTSEAIGLAQPLAAILTGGDQKLGSDFTGYFVNAATSNATTLNEVKQNMLAIFDSFQITPEQAAETLFALGKEGKIKENEFEAYLNGFSSIFRFENTQQQESSAEYSDAVMEIAA